MIVKIKGKGDSSWFLFESAENIFYIKNLPKRYEAVFDHISGMSSKDQLDVFKKVISDKSTSSSYIEFSKDNSKYGVVFDTTAFLMNDEGETVENIESSNLPYNNPENHTVPDSVKEPEKSSGDENVSLNNQLFEDVEKSLNSADGGETEKISERMKKIAGIEESELPEDQDPLQHVIENSNEEELQTFSHLLIGIGNLNDEDREEIDTNALFYSFVNSSVDSLDDLNNWVEQKNIDVPGGEVGLRQIFPDDPSELAEEAFGDVQNSPSYSETRRVEFSE